MTFQSDWPSSVAINEVGPRDGFQAEPTFIPTARKVEIIDALSRSGMASLQVTSAVHPRVVPQLADAEEVMARIERRPGVRYTVLVPNLRGAERAVAMRADGWELMLSVTDSHSIANSNGTTDQRLADFERVVALAQEAGVEPHGGMATALGCPFEGRVPYERILHVAEAWYGMGVRHMGLADTVGVADPRHVYDTVSRLRARFPDVTFGLHFHNTRGMALANVVAGLEAGVREFDASVGGLGGCPFAPGASGNLASEDLVHMLDLMGVEAGVNLDTLLAASRLAGEIVGHALESTVLRAGKAGELHPAPARQVLTSGATSVSPPR